MAEHEIGYLICRTGRRLTRTKTVHGNRRSVSLPSKCKQGKPFALHHTHPSGNMNLSDQDISTAKKHKIPHVCVQHKRKVKCYKIRLKRS